MWKIGELNGIIIRYLTLIRKTVYLQNIYKALKDIMSRKMYNLDSHLEFFSKTLGVISEEFSKSFHWGILFQLISWKERKLLWTKIIVELGWFTENFTVLIYNFNNIFIPVIMSWPLRMMLKFKDWEFSTSSRISLLHFKTILTTIDHKFVFAKLTFQRQCLSSLVWWKKLVNDIVESIKSLHL